MKELNFVRLLVVRAWLAAGLLGGLVGWTSLDAQSPPSPPDWVITHNARRTLWSDPNLTKLNIGVRVRDGEALLWGPVLTPEQAAEAVARVKLVPGVKTVINELFVLPADDVLRRRLPDRPIVIQPVKPLPQATNTSGVKPLP